MKPYLKIKRVGDFLLAGISSLVFLPVFLLIAIIIKFESPGRVFFKQKRIGTGKSTFMIYKFRTMRMDTPKDMPTHMLDNPGRYITKSGRLLRKSSLDEIPQLLNIIRGEMSIIGPRPALWNQEDLIRERDLYDANSIRPGLTGWAQVNGRDELAIPIKAELDGYYIRHVGFPLDVRIFWYTLRNVITKKGVVEGKSDTDTDSSSFSDSSN